MEFKGFEKISRFSRPCLISEKLDGTSACIGVGETGVLPSGAPDEKSVACIATLHGPVHIYAGSRNRWLLPGKGTDNFGFAAWVADHAEDLLTLGPGRHYGEWWGQGIQRGYGLNHKKFSLFNVSRWSSESLKPDCCDVVPVLYSGDFDSEPIYDSLAWLMRNGSLAAPGYDRPEGMVSDHTAGNILFKRTIEADAAPKSLAIAA